MSRFRSATRRFKTFDSSCFGGPDSTRLMASAGFASLLRHRDLWLAALLDRPGVANYAEPGRLLISGLIKLRDLSDNFWNADTLFVLTQTHVQARETRPDRRGRRLGRRSLCVRKPRGDRPSWVRAATNTGS